MVADRSALNHVSVKGIKTVREAVHNYGGAQNVPNTAALLNSVKHSHHEKRCKNIGIDKFNEDLEYLQKKLMRHLEKKTCNVYIKCSSRRINKFMYKTNYFFKVNISRLFVRGGSAIS